MIGTLIAATLVLASMPQEGKRVQSLTGTIRQHKGFKSNLLQNERNLIVYLPPGYETNASRRYPVLYMGDGQNIFDGMTSYIPNMEWRIDETAEALINAHAIEPLIVVGVDNAGASRADEYLPTRAQTRFSEQPVGGKANLFARFLIEEVKAFVDKTYRTKRGPQDTALGASSFGGVMSLHIGVTRSNVFGKIAVVSPSVWWDDRVLVKNVQELKRKPNLRIWLDMGTDEGTMAVRDTDKLRDVLVEKGFTPGKDLMYYVDKGAKHNEDAWAKRVGMMLMFLFPRKG